MIDFSRSNLEALQETAVTAAAYLDACDSAVSGTRLDPDYYRACASLLAKIFAMVDPLRAFPVLMAESPAAREMAEALTVGRRLSVSRLVYYPQLAVVINRIAA